MELDEREVLLRAIAELATDDEFGRRWHVGEQSRKTATVIRYLVDRGVDEALASVVALAYVAGALHTMGEVERKHQVLVEALGL